ncbi:MAG: HEC/Ndc80p family-domain-containing protein [Podila humilis]|nr:MAG: HEC/Ndc80p family-domain-containing protein [Podila humilis]
MYNSTSNNNNSSMGGGGIGSANSRWSVSSNLRQSVNSQPRSSMLNSSMMMPQRPSPMRPLTENDYGALNSSVMGPPTNRRQSYAFRQSINGGGLSASSTTNARDPRPVKDKTFQRNTILGLINYLTQAGYPNAVSQRTFTQPSNKDFQDVFKFLYNKLEPGFEFQKRFEEEVPILLKTMRYPAADSISRTTLYAVGTPHSWPNMLALLGWMVDLITIVDKFNELVEHLSLGNNPPPPRNRDIDPQMDLTLVSTHQALYTYLTRSYRTWMLTGESDLEAEDMLTRSFLRFKDVNESDVRKQMEENDTLRQTLETARNEVSPLLTLEEEQQRLRADIEKFKTAIEHVRPRIEEIRKDNEAGKQEIVNLTNLAAQLDTAVKETKEVIRAQTVTKEGLETKLEERNGLRRREAGLKQQVSELENQHRVLEKRFSDGEIEAERRAKEYNSLAVKIGIVPSTAKYAKGQDFELRLHLENASRITSSSTIGGHAPLYSVDIKGKAEQTVSALRNQLNRDANQTNMELSTLQEDLETLSDTLADDESELRFKESHNAMLNKKYQEEKENARNEAISRQTYVESRAEQIRLMKLETAQNVAECDRLDQEQAYLERQASQNREQTHRKIKELLQQLASVKQLVEQHVGVISTMAAKELADTLQERAQLQKVIGAHQQARVAQQGGEEGGAPALERDLLFS